MKLTLVLALVVAVATAKKPDGTRDPSKKGPKKNRIVNPLVTARHTDRWCHKHHHRAGHGGCVIHNGCCHSKVVEKQFQKLSAKNRIAPNQAVSDSLRQFGPCHSCDHHDHAWCKLWGSVSTRHCISLSMCTWKVSKTEGQKGECESKVLPTDFEGAIDDGRECNKNLGNTETKVIGGAKYDPDQNYVKWVTCLGKSKKSTDGNMCFAKEGNKMVKQGPPLANSAGKKWFPKKDLCANYESCKKDRAWNRETLARCPDDQKFKWEMPSQTPTRMKENGKWIMKKNTRIGTNADGCREMYAYKARCVMKDGKPTNKYMPFQADEDNQGFDGYFCVDENGHEIPDTRKKRPVELFDINCVVQRQKHEGQQCPNAVTLTTRGGGVVVNKRNGKKRDCVVHCNSDTDCQSGGQWCCYNGCGYKCMTPLKEPLAGCQNPPGAELLLKKRWALASKKGDAHTGKGRHGITLVAKCAPLHAQVPTKKTGPNPIQSLELKCQHGSWVHCAPGKDCIREKEFKKLLECKPDCKPFILATETVTRKNDKGVMETVTIERTVDPARSNKKDLYQDTRVARNRDILISKRTGFKASADDREWLRHHGATRTITCPPGYGAVQHEAFLGKSKRKRHKGKKSAKSLSIVRHGYEVLTCGSAQDGVWELRTLECSVCYDAYEWQWRDKKGNSCAYYRSRPLKCHDTAQQTVPAYSDTGRDDVYCGKFTAEWAQVGMRLLKRQQINIEIYRDYYQPWGDVPIFKEAPYKDQPQMKADPNYWSKNRAGAKTINANRPCACVPDVQAGYYLDPATKKPTRTSPPNVCGQMVPGKKVYLNPMTDKKFSKGGDDGNGNVFENGYYIEPQISYGTAVDACRVACRSCERAEDKYLQRTRYNRDVFKHMLATNAKFKKNVGAALGGSDEGKGKWQLVKRKVLEWVKHTKKQTVTKVHSKSYPISQVCTDGKGTNFLKCDVLDKDPRDICKPENRAGKIDPATKCKIEGNFKPMTAPSS